MGHILVFMAGLTFL